MVESHSHEGGREDLGVHLAPSALQVVPLPVVHVAGCLPGPHGEKVGHQGGEPGGKAGLGDEAELQLREADDVVPVTQGPAGDVHQVGLAVRGEGGGQWSVVVTVTLLWYCISWMMILKSWA